MIKFAARLFVFCVALPSLWAEPANILVNADFTQPPVANRVPGWDKIGPDNIVPDGNARILRLNWGQGGYTRQIVAVPAGSKTAAFSAKVRQGETAGADFEVCFQALDANQKPLSLTGQPTTQGIADMLGHAMGKTSKAWKTIHLHNKIPPNTAFISVAVFAIQRAGMVEYTEITCGVAK